MSANHCAILPMLLLCGCVAAPVQEMSNARQAIAAAERIVDAHQPGAASLAAARAALAGAEVSLHHHDFHLARDQAIKARQLALAAQNSTGESAVPQDMHHDMPHDATEY